MSYVSVDKLYLQNPKNVIFICTSNVMETIKYRMNMNKNEEDLAFC